MKTPHLPNDVNSAFHQGEVLAQDMSTSDTVGLSKIIAERTKGFIRPFMPQQHRAFFESGPLMMLGLLDQSGHPVAVPVWGDEGYIRSPSDTRLQISIASAAFDLLDAQLGLDIHTGSKIGLLGLELATRRRNRLNGVISHLKDTDMHVSVEQSFGNCPQYIHTRESTEATSSIVDTNVQVTTTKGLSQRLRDVIESADTFFIASRHARLGENVNEGIDVSHRGGKSGFVSVDNNTLTIPDFSGNKFFNTIGNILVDDRVGLCFLDNDTGTLHFLQGRAAIIWDKQLMPEFKGAERFIQIDITQSTTIEHCYPFRHQLIQHSPAVDKTGVWRNAN